MFINKTPTQSTIKASQKQIQKAMESYGCDEERPNAATRAACEIAEVLRSGDVASLSKETIAWLIGHEALNRQYIEAKQASEERKKKVENALSKLTDEEKNLLGYGPPEIGISGASAPQKMTRSFLKF